MGVYGEHDPVQSDGINATGDVVDRVNRYRKDMGLANRSRYFSGTFIETKYQLNNFDMSKNKALDNTYFKFNNPNDSSVAKYYYKKGLHSKIRNIIKK